MGGNTTPKVRCWGYDNELHRRYHDLEWGTPIHDDRILYEFIALEGFQAGLTWDLVLRRRGQLHEAFDRFDPVRVAGYSDKDVARLIASPGMIRNRRKIMAAINNARMLLNTAEEFGSFDAYIWRFVGGKPVDHALKDFKDMPAFTKEAEAMSKDLKRRGFSFVGPTICYAFMQAVGMVNDHLVHCFRYEELREDAEKQKRN